MALPPSQTSRSPASRSAHLGWFFSALAGIWGAFNIYRLLYTEPKQILHFSLHLIAAVSLLIGIQVTSTVARKIYRPNIPRSIPKLPLRGFLGGLLVGLGIGTTLSVLLLPLSAPPTSTTVLPTSSAFPMPTTPPLAPTTSPAPPTNPQPDQPQSPPIATVLTPGLAPSASPPSATPAPQELLKGTCDKGGLPCIYYDAKSWEELTDFLFSGPEECRWPELATMNRDLDGQYRVPLPSRSAILIALPGTFLPMVTKLDAVWSYIPQCSNDSQKPCLFTVPSGVYGSQQQAYGLIAQLVYGRSEPIFAIKIAGANLASDCKATPQDLAPGIMIVIPK